MHTYYTYLDSKALKGDIMDPMSRDNSGFPNRSDTNGAAQAQKMTRDCKFWI